MLKFEFKSLKIFYSVPPERQKILTKGSTLKQSWDGFDTKLKNGAIVLLMGSADALPEKPKEEVKFIEDMSEADVNKALKLPPGIVNLGMVYQLVI